MQAVHGFVNHKMHKGGFFAYIPSVGRGQVGVVVLLAAVCGQMDIGVRQFAHLAVGDLAPVAGNYRIHTFKAVGQIHHHHIELGAGSALQKQHFVVVGDIHQLAQVLLGVVEDAHKHIGAVAHGHHRKAGAVVVEHFALGGAQYRFGQNGRAGRKIIDGGIAHGDNRPLQCFC